MTATDKVPSLSAQASTELVSRAMFLGRQAFKANATTHRLSRILNEFTDKAATHNANPIWNDTGKLQHIRKDAEGYARQLGLAKAAVGRHRNVPAQARGELVTKAFEPWKDDNAAPEIRAVLRQMAHGEVVKLASSDPRVLAAIVLSPPILHKVQPDAIEHLVDAHLANHHAAELKKVAALQEGADIASAMLNVAMGTFRDALCFGTAKQFDDFMSDHGPSANDVAKEAAGDVPSGVRKLGTDSLSIFNSDIAKNEAA
jgi:hypothetical protein